MKKRSLLICIVLILCIGLTGCKSQDYKDAVKLQETGDYAAALTLYQGTDGYKDSADRIKECELMIVAIEKFDSAKSAADEKNKELDTAISESETLIANKEPSLDDTLIPALETAISEAKAAKKTIPEMPSTADEIDAVTAELNAVDYNAVSTNLSTQKAALEKSIKQYALVNAPTEAYIIDCLGKVVNVVDISAVTEDNDPNGNLNKAGGYTAQVYFTSDLVNQGDVYGATVIDKGTDGGGSIEVYATADDAIKRNEYLKGFDGGIFASGSHTVIGTVIVRTSDKLKASQQKEMETNIIAALTNIGE